MKTNMHCVTLMDGWTTMELNGNLYSSLPPLAVCLGLCCDFSFAYSVSEIIMTHDVESFSKTFSCMTNYM